VCIFVRLENPATQRVGTPDSLCAVTLLAEKPLLSVARNSVNALSSVLWRKARDMNKRQQAQLTSGVTGLAAWCQWKRDTYCPGRAGPLGQLSAGQQAPTLSRRFVVFVAKGTASDIFVYRNTTHAPV
jgi:hypothetical protein